MDGGAPAGTSNFPGDEGCRTNITIMRIMTMVGKRTTRPSGIEMDELPLRRMRRRRKARRGESRSPLDSPSSRGATVRAVGMRFLRLCRNDMCAVVYGEVWGWIEAGAAGFSAALERGNDNW